MPKQIVVYSVLLSSALTYDRDTLVRVFIYTTCMKSSELGCLEIGFGRVNIHCSFPKYKIFMAKSS